LYGEDISADSLEPVLVVIIHPAIRPMVTITSGVIFMYVGKMNREFLIGEIQDIILPDVMDRLDRASMGITTMYFSVTFIILALEFEDHIVTNLNRIE
jgi:hypothetical protein